MNITNNDFDILKDAIEILRTVTLPEEDQKKALSALDVMESLKAKKLKDNKRIAAYIAEKRKINKNYATGKKEV